VAAVVVSRQPAGGGQGRGGAGGRGANAAPEVPRKDRLMQWLPPFSETSTKLIYENPTQMSNVRFSPDGQIMFFTENNNLDGDLPQRHGDQIRGLARRRWWWRCCRRPWRGRRRPGRRTRW
jgi:hypothetical protein